MAHWIRVWWSRLTAGLALLVVASVTGVISYTHVYDLTVSLHQPVMVARLMPFGVDGLIVVGSVVLLQAAPGQTWLGWLGIVPGVAASLFDSPPRSRRRHRRRPGVQPVRRLHRLAEPRHHRTALPASEHVHRQP